MTEITLTGRLICRTPQEAAIVRDNLTLHIRLTRAEPGCIGFTVTSCPGKLIFDAAGRFTSVEAFEAHQRRTRESAWFHATREIIRDCVIVKG